jgi:CRISPR/Cas system-associated exonuclease Cas4 (RecB family)
MSYQNTIKLAEEIIEKRNNYLRDKIKIYPTTNFRASEIPDCDRQMVYSVLNWKDRKKHDEGLQAIFDAGNKEEASVKNRLGYELGFEFIQQQADFEIKNTKSEIMCRGHIDGKVLYHGEAIPIEIKSMDGNIFNSIHTLDDFKKRAIHRKYLRQMQLYLYGNNEEAGLFILSNFRHDKILPVALDYGECEKILQRIERNWEFVKAGEYPDVPDFADCSGCERCGFNHICLPDIEHAKAMMIDSEEIESQLERRAELKSDADAYKELDEEIKERFKETDNVLIGTNWQVITKKSQSKRVDTKLIPDDIKKQYEVDSERTTVKIIDLRK